MAETEGQAGGAQTEDGGATSDEQQQNSQVTTTTDAGGTPVDGVRREDHQRALNDMHKFKREAAELKQRLNALEESKLAEQNDFKSLAEKYKLERDEAVQKSDSLKSSIVQNEKSRAIQAKARQLGLRPEAESDLELLNLDDVEVEYTSTGRINVLGVDGFVEGIKKTRPHWFQGPKVPRINAGGGHGADNSSGAMTVQQFVQKEMELKRKGDQAGLKALYADYQKQLTEAKAKRGA